MLYVMCFTSAVVDRACFKKTSEMTKIKNFDCQLLCSPIANFEIDHSATDMNVKFYAGLSLLQYGAYSRPFARPIKFKKDLKLFLGSCKRRLSYCFPVSHPLFIFQKTLQYGLHSICFNGAKIWNSKKTPEMAKIKNFNCQLLFSNC